MGFNNSGGQIKVFRAWGNNWQGRAKRERLLPWQMRRNSEAKKDGYEDPGGVLSDSTGAPVPLTSLEVALPSGQD